MLQLNKVDKHFDKKMDNKNLDYLREYVLEELESIAELYRRKSNYKRYSKGMKSAFRNRAVGIEKALSLLKTYVYLQSEVEEEFL